MAQRGKGIWLVCGNVFSQGPSDSITLSFSISSEYERVDLVPVINKFKDMTTTGKHAGLLSLYFRSAK